MLTYIWLYDSIVDFWSYVKIKIQAMVLVYYKFDINKIIKKSMATLLVNNTFICKDYRLINPILLLKSLLIILIRF